MENDFKEKFNFSKIFYFIKRGNLERPFLCFRAILILLFLAVVLGAGSFLSFKDNNLQLTEINTSFSGNSSLFAVPQNIEKESPDFNLFQKNSLLAVSPPIMVTPQVLGALAEASRFDEVEKEIVEYIVEPGDTLSGIANKFNISLETILWANNLSRSSSISSGKSLIILPVSGAIHHVQNGDTLSGIAKSYKAEKEEIIVFNNLSQRGDIYIGDILIIPGGTMPLKTSPVRYTPLASSYFICPIGSPCNRTNRLHWYNAIDFSNGKCGEPIYASASGEVLKVKLTNSRSKGAFNGAGNHLTILHPNGVVTFYGHLLSSIVSPGDWVSQGQIIAFIGGQPGTPGAGNSTGCHVHFGVTGARNPFSF